MTNFRESTPLCASAHLRQNPLCALLLLRFYASAQKTDSALLLMLLRFCTHSATASALLRALLWAVEP